MAQDLFMTINGRKFPWNILSPGAHGRKPGEIEILSFRAIGSSASTPGHAREGKVTPKPVMIEKKTDWASLHLQHAKLFGKTLEEIKIHDRHLVLYTFKMCFITSIQRTSKREAEHPHEELTFSYGQMTVSYPSSGT